MLAAVGAVWKTHHQAPPSVPESADGSVTEDAEGSAKPVAQDRTCLLPYPVVPAWSSTRSLSGRAWETTELLGGFTSSRRPVLCHREATNFLPPKAVLVVVGDPAASEEVVAYSASSRKQVLLPLAS